MVLGLGLGLPTEEKGKNVLLKNTTHDTMKLFLLHLDLEKKMFNNINGGRGRRKGARNEMTRCN